MRGILPAMIVMVVAVSCGSSPDDGSSGTVEQPTGVTMPQMRVISSANTRFALDLYGVLGEKPGNLFVSPFSISTALAMTYAGARGATAGEMARVLRFPPESPELHRGFQGLLHRFQPSDNAPYRLDIANRLWGQKGFAFREDFLALCRTSYGSELARIDFAADTEGARREINRWVAARTRDKIRDLLPPGALSPVIRLVLTNAIYFKGDWALEFDPDRTEDRPFWLTAESSVDVPMMGQHEDFLYAKLDGLRILELPYEGDRLSMLVLLPETRDGIRDLENSVTADSLETWRQKLTPGDVDVRLPRFEMRSRFQLGETLSSMGMPLALTERADFSGMTEEAKLFINAVVHEAYVKVNEEGTEAAAATGAVLGLTSVIEPAEPRRFHADHPFLFFIQDRQTASVLFLGRVVDPTSGTGKQ